MECVGLAGVVSGHPCMLFHFESEFLDSLRVHIFICGSVVCACVETVDTIKVRLQSQSGHNPKYRGTIHCCTTIIKEEGVHILPVLNFLIICSSIHITVVCACVRV